MTYNDAVSVRAPIAIGIECGVKAKEMISLVNALKVETLDIDFKNDQLLISGPTSRAGMISVVDWSERMKTVMETLKVDPAAWLPVPSDLQDAIRICSFSTSKELIMGALCCINIKDDKVCSCDDYRISTYQLGSSINANVLVRGNDIIGATKLGRFAFYNITDAWLHIKFEDETIYSCRRVWDDYPDVGGFFEKKDGLPISFSTDVLASLERNMVFAEGEKETQLDTKVTIKPGGAGTLHSYKDGVGWEEEDIQVGYDGKDEIVFKANPVFLSQVINKSMGVTYCPNERRLVFESGQFNHVLSVVQN